MILEAADLIMVIKACRKAKVTEIKTVDLELRFQSGDAVKPKGEPNKPPTESELNSAGEEAVKLAHHDAIEDDLATLQIDDPQEFERLLIERELEFAPSATEAAQDQ